MKQPLLLFPFNGNAVEALDCLGTSYELIGFIDDDTEKQGSTRWNIPVFSRSALQTYPNAKVLAVPGSPSTYTQKTTLIREMRLPEKRFATIIHPSAQVSPMAKVGYNVLIMAGVVVTASAVIGNHVVILPNAVIHHDTVIGDYTSIGSNVTIAGRTKIGVNCYIGSSASVINDVSIGDYTLIGMGSNVLHSFPQQSKVAGNPGKSI